MGVLKWTALVVGLLFFLGESLAVALPYTSRGDSAIESAAEARFAPAAVLVARRRKRRRRRRRRRAVQEAPKRPPAAAAKPAASAPPPAAGQALRRGRVEFDGRLVQGQTAKSGAIYLFARKRSELRSMVKERESYRRELDRTVYPATAEGL